MYYLYTNLYEIERLVLLLYKIIFTKLNHSNISVHEQKPWLTIIIYLSRPSSNVHRPTSLVFIPKSIVPTLPYLLSHTYTLPYLLSRTYFPIPTLPYLLSRPYSPVPTFPSLLSRT